MSRHLATISAAMLLVFGAAGLAAPQTKPASSANAKKESADDVTSFALGVALGLAADHSNAPESKDAGDAAIKKQPASTKAKTEFATFGGGCFWSMEAIFERIPGVKSVVSGFSGGTVARPAYEEVCTGLTGHAEVVRIEFDPKVTSYEKLLQVFFSARSDDAQPPRRG